MLSSLKQLTTFNVTEAVFVFSTVNHNLQTLCYECNQGKKQKSKKQKTNHSQLTWDMINV